MSVFTMRKSSILSRDDLFNISTDVSNFHNVFPKYFKSIKIVDESDYVKKHLKQYIFWTKNSCKNKT